MSLEDFWTARRKYVSIMYDEETQEKLREWCIANAFDLTRKWNGKKQAPEAFTFHSSLMFSSNRLTTPNEVIHLNKSEAVVTGIALMGAKRDTPVLKVSSSAINDLRDDLIRTHGMKCSFAEFKPHVTVSYNLDVFDMSNIEIPNFRLYFEKMRIEDLVD